MTSFEDVWLSSVVETFGDVTLAWNVTSAIISSDIIWRRIDFFGLDIIFGEVLLFLVMISYYAVLLFCVVTSISDVLLF